MYQMYEPFDPLKCGAFRFLQEIFVHRTYSPPSVGFPLFAGNFSERNVRTMARSGSPQSAVSQLVGYDDG